MANMDPKSEPRARGALGDDTAVYPEYVDRWAIVVGISKYQDPRWNLKYADRDAEELYNLIRTPSGGGFEEGHIRRLVNEQATTANITRALRSFLKKPAREDIVLIYFSCHGGPDIDRPENVYLMTYDTDPADIAGTALPMREIDLALKENLLAERVVIIADACHSAALGGRIGTRAIDEFGVFNHYLQSLSEANAGVAWLTSAEAREVAREDERWGGGHGVFTHFLLEGMKGKADHPIDGIVGIQELFEYVRDHVKKATDDKQHPVIGPNPFDPKLPMAYTGGLRAKEELYPLGCRLYDLGRLLNDSRRLEASKAQLDQALQLAVDPFPDANRQLGLTWIAMGKYDEAIEAFKQALEEPLGKKLPDLAFHLGIAYAKVGNYGEAITAFEQFLVEDAESDNAAWVKEYMEWLKNIPSSQKHALLIGIGKYLDPGLSPLFGSETDLKLMKGLLIEKLGFPNSNVRVLSDAGSTRQGILDALAWLIQNTRPYDTVVIYYSGIGWSRATAPCLVPYDAGFDSSNQLVNAITGEELHQSLIRVPAHHTTLILDTESNATILELAEKENAYAVFMAASPGEKIHEHTVELDGARLSASLFTYSLVEQLKRSNPREITYVQVLLPVIEGVQNHRPELNPMFVGDRYAHVFAEADDFLDAYDFSVRRNYQPLKLEQVRGLYTAYRKRVTAPFPQMHYSFGRAFFEHGSYDEAIPALEYAIQQSHQDYADAALIKSLAQVGISRSAQALDDFRQRLAVAHAHFSKARERTSTLLNGLNRKRKHALLVGINEYPPFASKRVRGAVNDALAIKQVLVECYGFQDENITLLLDGQATRRAIMENFQELVRKAHYEPALFYFAGLGSINAGDAPTIVSSDGRQGEVFDIELQRLATLTSYQETNLTTIIDAGWTLSYDLEHSRTVARDERDGPVTREALALRDQSRDLSALNLRIGNVSIYTDSIAESNTSRVWEVEGESEVPQGNDRKIVHGYLTLALISALREANPTTLSYKQLLAAIRSKGNSPETLCDRMDDHVFEKSVFQIHLQELWRDIKFDSVEETIQILKDQIAEREGGVYPEAHLNLGIAYGARGDYAESIGALEKAISQQDHGYPEAYFHLGVILVESKGDLNRAVSELDRATKQDSSNIAAYYYLGQALRTLGEKKETLDDDAEKAFRKYLDQGAPLGFEDQIQQFLLERRLKKAAR